MFGCEKPPAATPKPADAADNPSAPATPTQGAYAYDKTNGEHSWADFSAEHTSLSHSTVNYKLTDTGVKLFGGSTSGWGSLDPHSLIELRLSHQIIDGDLETKISVTTSQSSSETPDHLPANIKLPVDINSLEGAQVTVTHSQSSTSSTTPKWPMPENASIVVHPNRDFTGLTNEYQVIWRIDIVDQEGATETVAHLARFSTEADREEDYKARQEKIKAILSNQLK
jgi:hypothetical protein